MIEGRVRTSTTAVEGRLRGARRRGFADGIASVLCNSTTGRPVRVRLHGGTGSLLEDWQALQRDGERLFDERP